MKTTVKSNSIYSMLHVDTNSVQTPIVSRESEMAPNRGGGFGFVVTDKTIIERILILGTCDGYYSSANDNTKEAITTINKLLREEKQRLVLDIVKDVYFNNRAAKLDPTFVVLALLCHDKQLEVRREACEIVSKLNTFSQLCTFLKYYISAGAPKKTETKEANSGCWGSLMKKTLTTWVTKLTGRDLTYQVFKYLSRDGWTFRDVLRCIHIKSDKLPAEVQMVLKLVIKYENKNINSKEAFDEALKFGKELGVSESDLSYIEGIKFMKTCPENDNLEIMCQVISQHNFTHEFVPKWALKEKSIWLSLLLNKENHIRMPLTALIRNLGVMTCRGVFEDVKVVDEVVNTLSNQNIITKSKIHPATLTIAWKQYAQGRGEKGSNTWTPVNLIINALENSIYMAFKNVEPTGMKILHAFDGSGSMTCPMTVLPCMTSAEAVALLGLVCSRTENASTQKYVVFSSEGGNYSHNQTGLRPLAFTPTTKLSDAARITQITDWSSTNCALPIDDTIRLFKQQYGTLASVDKTVFQTALKENDQETLSAIRNSFGIFLPEVFVIYTDNDVNSGRHPILALKEYRELTGIPAKFAVVATSASKISIADPKDSHMLDFVGFDSSLPQLLHDFICGKI